MTIPNTKSIIISGAVTSGKSSLTKELEKKLKIKLINEETIGNYYKILDSINPYLYPQAIYEHCQIYKKQFIFKPLYEKNILVILSVLPELLLKNYQSRIAKSSTGDFTKIDPIKQQEEILENIKLLSKDFSDKNNQILRIQINSLTDYSKAEEKIIIAFKNL